MGDTNERTIDEGEFQGESRRDATDWRLCRIVFDRRRADFWKCCEIFGVVEECEVSVCDRGAGCEFEAWGCARHEYARLFWGCNQEAGRHAEHGARRQSADRAV